MVQFSFTSLILALQLHNLGLAVFRQNPRNCRSISLSVSLLGPIHILPSLLPLSLSPLPPLSLSPLSPGDMVYVTLFCSFSTPPAQTGGGNLIKKNSNPFLFLSIMA